MWRGQCTSRTLLRSIKRPAWSLPVFSDGLLSPQRWGGGVVQGSEQLCRWGSLHHIKGAWKWGWPVGKVAFTEINSSLCSFFASLLVRSLTAEPICHHTHSYGMINTAVKSVCQRRDHSAKPQCLYELEWEIVTFDMQAPENDSKSALKGPSTGFPHRGSVYSSWRVLLNVKIEVLFILA